MDEVYERTLAWGMDRVVARNGVICFSVTTRIRSTEAGRGRGYNSVGTPLDQIVGLQPASEKVRAALIALYEADDPLRERQEQP